MKERIIADSTRYLDKNLVENTLYKYRLFAILEGQNSAPALAEEWTYPAKPILDSVSVLCQEGKAFVALSSTGNEYKVYAQKESEEVILKSSRREFDLPFITSDSVFYITTTGIKSKKESERTEVKVIAEPIFEALILGTDLQRSCVDSLVLEAQEVENATSYIWSRNGVEVGTGKTFTAKFAVEYQVRITRGACTFISKPVRVELNQTPVARILEKRADNEVTFCQTGNLTAYFAGQNATYIWTLNNTEIAQTRNISVSQSGTYTLLVSNNNCSASTEINVVIVPKPQAPVLVANTTTLCQNEKAIISVENPIDGITYQWLKEGRPTRLTGISIEVNIVGKYSIEAISSLGNSCKTVSNVIEISRFRVVPVYLRESEDKKKLFLESSSEQNEITKVEWYFDGEVSAKLGSASELLQQKEDIIQLLSPTKMDVPSKLVLFISLFLKTKT